MVLRMIRFNCDCGALLQCGESMAGEALRCPECESLMHVPEEGAADSDPAHRRCPDCDSSAIHRITSRRALRRKVQGGDPLAGDETELNQAFVFRLPRECRDCGAIWIPPLPRWSGTLLMICGALLVLFFLGLPIYLYCIVPGQHPVEVIYVSGGIVLGALALTGYGWRVAAGAPGRPRMLRAGERRSAP